MPEGLEVQITECRGENTFLSPQDLFMWGKLTLLGASKLGAERINLRGSALGV